MQNSPAGQSPLTEHELSEPPTPGLTQAPGVTLPQPGATPISGDVVTNWSLVALQQSQPARVVLVVPPVVVLVVEIIVLVVERMVVVVPMTVVVVGGAEVVVVGRAVVVVGPVVLVVVVEACVVDVVPATVVVVVAGQSATVTRFD